MKILKIEPMGNPKVIETDTLSLEWLQEQVGGNIEVVYPFDDPVGIVCDEEGKLKAKRLNRVLSNAEYWVYDILCGDFLIVGLGEEEEDFCGLSDELLDKYQKYFWNREYIWFDDQNRVRVTLIDDEDWERDWMADFKENDNE